MPLGLLLDVIYVVITEGLKPEQRDELDEELEEAAATSVVSLKSRQEYAASFGAARFARKE